MLIQTHTINANLYQSVIIFIITIVFIHGLVAIIHVPYVEPPDLIDTIVNELPDYNEGEYGLFLALIRDAFPDIAIRNRTLQVEFSQFNQPYHDDFDVDEYLYNLNSIYNASITNDDYYYELDFDISHNIIRNLPDHNHQDRPTNFQMPLNNNRSRSNHRLGSMNYRSF